MSVGRLFPTCPDGAGAVPAEAKLVIVTDGIGHAYKAEWEDGAASQLNLERKC
jgi:hypothetical protein